MKAVIPVAGFGTRFLPATKTQPKEMLPLVDKPVVQYIVEEIVESGVKNIIFVTTRHKRSLEDYFDAHFELEAALEEKGKLAAAEELRRIVRMAKFSFVRQNEPLGNGDAILAAAHLVEGEPFVVAFGDDVFLGKPLVTARLQAIYKKRKAPVCVLKRVPANETHMYGMVRAKKIGEREYEIFDVVEKPAKGMSPSNLAIFGRYILTPEIIGHLEALSPPPKGKELGLTDGMKRHLLAGGKFYGYEVPEEAHYDCGSKINFMKAVVHIGLEHKEIKHEFRKYLRSLKL